MANETEKLLAGVCRSPAQTYLSPGLNLRRRLALEFANEVIHKNSGEILNRLALVGLVVPNGLFGSTIFKIWGGCLWSSRWSGKPG